jgi:hypothetical protein
MNVQTMDAEARYYQYTLETQVLDHIKSALRQILEADEERLGIERKISSAKFVTESLKRHLSRMLDLEEADPLIDPVQIAEEEDAAGLTERYRRLRGEHTQLRSSLEQVAMMSAQMAADNEAMLEDFANEMNDFLTRLDRHEMAERALLIEVYDSDDGDGGEA